MCHYPLSAVFFLIAVSIAPVAADWPTFDVTKYGAAGDGKTKDTKAVRAAASALAAAGGGRLLFPAASASSTSSSTYYTGAFNLTSNAYMEVEAGATVLGSTDGDDWPLVDAGVVWPQFGHGSDCTPGSEECRLMHQAFLFAFCAENVTIAGKGTVDANANPSTWWSCAKDLSKPPCNGHGRPHLMMLSNVTDVEVADLSFRNSPDWTLHFASVTNLHVHDVHVESPADTPNTDGIDVDCTWNALIERSYFSTGDDALCVKSGIDYFGRLYNRPSKNVTFRDIQVGTGHGISIGSETSGGIQDILFENIAMQGTERGPRIKSQRGRGGVVENITFRNITAHNVEQMVSVTMDYHKQPPTNKSATPVFRNIWMEDITFIGGDDAGEFLGLNDSQIVNVTLKNCDFNGGKATWQECSQVDASHCDSGVNLCPPCF